MAPLDDNAEVKGVKKKPKKKLPSGSTSSNSFDSSISAQSGLEGHKIKGNIGIPRSSPRYGNDSPANLQHSLQSSISSAGPLTGSGKVTVRKESPRKMCPTNVTSSTSVSPVKTKLLKKNLLKGAPVTTTEKTMSSPKIQKGIYGYSEPNHSNQAITSSISKKTSTKPVAKRRAEPESRAMKRYSSMPTSTSATNSKDNGRLTESMSYVRGRGSMLTVESIDKTNQASRQESTESQRFGSRMDYKLPINNMAWDAKNRSSDEKQKGFGKESQKPCDVNYGSKTKQPKKESLGSQQSPKTTSISSSSVQRRPKGQPSPIKHRPMHSPVKPTSQRRPIGKYSNTTSGGETGPESKQKRSLVSSGATSGIDGGRPPELRKSISNAKASQLALRRPDSFARGRSCSPRHVPLGRASASDLQYMKHSSLQSDDSEGRHRSFRRCKSGDLELLAESSMHQRTGIPTLPSILKNSSHHAGLHGAALTPRRSTRARFLANGNTNASSDDDDDDDSIQEMDIKFDDEPDRPKSSTPRPGSQVSRSGRRPGLETRQWNRPGLRKARSGLTDMSGHSFMSTRSLMSQDKVEDFPDDPIWKKILRYIRILPPYVDERLEKRRIRIYIWCTLFLDFIAAMVSITTYNGVTTCCGVPIFSMTFLSVNWTDAIRVTTYIYLVMIFAEIIPVVRKGLPFNLLNPLVGFIITFAMFFDDRILGAVSMWIIEACAIYFEFLVYSMQRKLYHERYDRLDEVQKDLNPYISSRNLKPAKKRRAFSTSESQWTRKLSNSTNMSNPGHANSSDEDSFSGHSFGDDDNDIEDQLNKSAEFHPSTNHKLREARLLRERRILRQRKAADRKQLRYHLAGVIVNFGLICISLILIIVIASSGGLCIRTDFPIKVFDMNQLDRCSSCRGQIFDGKCEICGDTDALQCYYQYI